MQTYELRVESRAVRLESDDETLVRTSVGVDQVHVLFDNAEWLAFPVTATFGQGDETRTESVVVTAVDGSDEWKAEATARIPWEAIDEVGPVRVTFQGTDSQGNHIITAYGEPLRVEEAGDVALGDLPADAPTVDQWWQAYADAVAAANQAASLVENLQDRLSQMLSDAGDAISATTDGARAEIDAKADAFIKPATTESLGVVQIGDGITVTEEGVISAAADGMNALQRRKLENLCELAGIAFGADVSATVLNRDVTARRSVLPPATTVEAGAVIADGTTIVVDEDGLISCTGGKVATDDSAGIVKPDGETITVDPDGTLHGTVATSIATVENAGIVKPDGATIGIDLDGTVRAKGFNEYRYGTIGNSSYFSTMFHIIGHEDGIYNVPTVTSLPTAAFALCSIREIEMPACTRIGSYAFMSCSALRSASFPVCTSIGSNAFSACTSLESVHIPVCTSIGMSAFNGCNSLKNINISQCDTIGAYAFQFCTSLESVRIGNLQTVDNGTFNNCYKLSSIAIGECVRIGHTAFCNCSSLLKVDLASCMYIGSSAFMGCVSLSGARAAHCSYIGSSAFDGCTDLRVASFPTCSHIDSFAFSRCSSLSYVDLRLCASIGGGAFGYCKSLESIALPRCAYIGSYAFSRCTSLTAINLVGVYSVPTLGESAFYDTPIARSNGSIIVPQSLYSAFISAPNWSLYSSRIFSA